MLTVLAKQFSMETIDQEDMKEARALALHLLKAFWYVKKNFLRGFQKFSKLPVGNNYPTISWGVCIVRMTIQMHFDI